MDADASRQHHAPVRVLPHIKRLDDCFGQFLVRVTCPCGTSRHIEPEVLARLVGWKVDVNAEAARLMLDVQHLAADPRLHQHRRIVSEAQSAPK
jgi:hypothetical protein